MGEVYQMGQVEMIDMSEWDWLKLVMFEWDMLSSARPNSSFQDWVY